MSNLAINKTEHKDFSHADEVRTFEKGKLELLNIGGGHGDRTCQSRTWDCRRHSFGPFHGLQLGVFNLTDTMKGLQAGIINVIHQKSSLPIPPIVNWSF